MTFNIKDKDDILPCVEQLKELKKDIYISVFIPKKMKIAIETDSAWFQVKEEELGPNGLPLLPLCEQFNAVPTDILIDLTREDDHAMHYLELLHPVSFKIGNKSSLRDLFDLTIPMREDDTIPQSLQHILYYLQTIRSK